MPRRPHVVRRPARAALALAGLVLVTACSGGAEESAPADGAAPVDEAALVEDLAAHYRGDDSTARAVGEGECFAAEFVDRTDPDELRAAGLVDDDGSLVRPMPSLSEELATTWVAAQQACSDFIASSIEALYAQTKGELDRKRYRTCLRAELTDAQIREGLVAAIAGDLQGEAVAVLSDAQARCAEQALPGS